MSTQILEGIRVLDLAQGMAAPVAAMMLVEEGKLSLDAALDQWLPELADPKVLNDPNGPLDEVHDSPRPITVRDLLRYTMG